MTNEKAIEILRSIRVYDVYPKEASEETKQAIDIAIGALKRDEKVDDISFHWNDNKNSFVAACNAFEDILKVYGRGVGND